MRWVCLIPVVLSFQGEGDAMAAEVNIEDADGDMLVEVDDVAGMGNAAVGHLGDVDETILMDAEVDEGTEVGDVRDAKGQVPGTLAAKVPVSTQFINIGHKFVNIMRVLYGRKN